MKKILLSFKPFWYEKISTGEKIFEYRKDFVMSPYWHICMLVDQ